MISSERLSSLGRHTEDRPAQPVEAIHHVEMTFGQTNPALEYRAVTNHEPEPFSNIRCHVSWQYVAPCAHIRLRCGRKFRQPRGLCHGLEQELERRARNELIGRLATVTMIHVEGI